MAEQQPDPWCDHCGMHHPRDQRHQPTRTWFRRNRHAIPTRP